MSKQRGQDAAGFCWNASASGNVEIGATATTDRSDENTEIEKSFISDDIFPVHNLLRVKHIKDNPDEENGLLFIGSCTQTVNMTPGMDLYEKSEEVEKNYFPYRINEEVADDENGFMKVRRKEGNDNIYSTTFTVRAPLAVHTVFDKFPFRIAKASITIELDAVFDKEEKKRIRPELYLDLKHKCANVAIQQTETSTHKIVDKLDQTNNYDFVTPYPEVYYKMKLDHHGNNSGFSKFVVSFYFIESGFSKFIEIVFPMLLIYFMNIINVSMNHITAPEDYLANSATFALTVVFLLNNVITKSRREEIFNVNTMYVLLIFISLMLCSIPEKFLATDHNLAKVLSHKYMFDTHHLLPAEVGGYLFGFSFFIPFCNFVRFLYKCRDIKSLCPSRKDFTNKDARPFNSLTHKYMEYFSPVASLITTKEHALLKERGYVVESAEDKKSTRLSYSTSSDDNNGVPSKSAQPPGVMSGIFSVVFS